MTISVNVQLPIGSKDTGVQVTMSAEDAVALIGEIGSLLKGEVTAGEMLSTIKAAITSKLPTNL